jgi:type IX secretion system PorP/SprF family membrane protein
MMFDNLCGMKKILIFGFLLICLSTAHSQSPGPFFRQFLPNPYLFNPAYVAINDQAEADLFYRKQWVNFKDAPVTSGFSLQYPTNGRVILGMNFVSDKQVLLKNSTFMGTFGYVVPISQNESLRFGISGGIGMNKLDLSVDELNTNDPAILNAANNNYYIDGNFGVVYTYGGLRLGFALTDIFESNPFNTETFNKFKLSNLRNRLYSASYRFKVGVMEEFSLEPYVLYRQTQDGLQDYWEAASMVYYKDRIWAGASYNQNNGLGLFLGMNVVDKFNFSYSYEFPPFNTEFAASSSHELHVGFKFGTKKSRPLITRSSSYKKTVAQNRKSIKRKMNDDRKTSEKVAQLNDETMPGEGVIEDNTSISSTPSAPGPVQEAFGDGTPPKGNILAPGYYVVVGAFSVPKYAYRYSRQIKAKGYSPTVSINPQKNLYYVYIFATYDVDEAKKVRLQYKGRNVFSDAWIFVMN